MSAGTLTLTNGSAVATGAGTTFTTELAAGDFVVATIGGIPYTLPVKTVDSTTQLTLVSNFTGPTQAGAAWYAVPRAAMNLVTAAVVTQAAEALRGLNYDKQNWQQVFSGTGTVTVKLPDGSSYTGPAWGGITAGLDGKAAKGKNSDITELTGLTTPLSIAQGGTGASTKSAARSELGLGSAATKNTGTSPGDVTLVGAFGLGTSTVSQPAWTAPQNENRFIEVPPNNGSPFGSTGGGGIAFSSGASAYGAQLMVSLFGDRMAMRSWNPTTFSNGVEFWSSGNTTVDVNGFLKRSSPVVKIFGTGNAETNGESEGLIVTRTGIGEYLIAGCEGLNSDASWGGIDGGFEVPTDRNKQPRIWLDYEVNPNGSIVVKTFHRTHPDAPEFARNLIGVKNTDGTFTETVTDGEPVDIPADAFVSVRVEMPVDSIWNQRQREAEEAMKRAQAQASE